jgi:peptide/nickel transport system substrate-binding protein
VAYLWDEWYESNGASGIEPPADALELYDLSAQFQQYPLGSDESNALGEQIVGIHVDNLWKIGIAGDIKAPIIHSNRLGNWGPYTLVSYDYYRPYPMIPAQWYFTE